MAAPQKVGKVMAKDITLDTVTLVWPKAANAQTYTVEYSGGGAFSFARYTWYVAEGGDAVTGCKFTVRNLAENTTYYFRVKGVNSSGTPGEASDQTDPVNTLTADQDRQRLITENERIKQVADDRGRKVAEVTDTEYVDRLQRTLNDQRTRLKQQSRQVRHLEKQLLAAKNELAAAQARCEEMESQVAGTAIESAHADAAKAKAEAEAAVKQLREEQAARATQVTDLQTRLQKMEDQVAAAQATAAAAQARVEAAQECAAAATSEGTDAQRDAAARAEKVVLLEAQLVNLRSQMQATVAEAAAAEAARGDAAVALRKQIEELEASHKAVSAELAAAKATIADQGEALGAATTRMDQVTQQCSEAQDSRDEALEAVRKLETESLELRERLATLQTELADGHSAVESATATTQRLRERVVALEGELDAAREKEAQLTACKARVANLEATIEELTKRCAEQTEAAAARDAEASADLGAAEERAAELTTRVADLEAKLAAATAQASTEQSTASEHAAALAEAQARLASAQEQLEASKAAEARLKAKLATANDEHTERKRALEAQAKAAATEATAARSEAEEAKAAAEAAALKVEHHQALATASGNRAQELADQVQDMKTQMEVLHGELARQSRQGQGWRKEVAAATARATAAEAKAAEAVDKADKLETHLDVANQLQQQAQQDLAAFQVTAAKEKQALSDKLSATTAEAFSLRDQLQLAKSKLEGVERRAGQADVANTLVDDMRKLLAEREREIMRVQSENVTLVAGLREAQQETTRQNANMAHTENLNKQLKGTITELQRQLKQAREEASLNFARVSHLEELNTRLENANEKLQRMVDAHRAGPTSPRRVPGEHAVPAAAPSAATLRKESTALLRDMGMSATGLKAALDNLAYFVDDLGYAEEAARMAILEHPGDRDAQLHALLGGRN